jgi:hypothetical protein
MNGLAEQVVHRALFTVKSLVHAVLVFAEPRFEAEKGTIDRVKKRTGEWAGR